MELALRGGALLLTGLALWRLLLAATAPPATHHIVFSASPEPRVRDSLAALARSGEPVTWSGRVAGVAAMAEGIRDPAPAIRISVVGDSAATVVDALGLVDSIAPGGGALTISAGAAGEGIAAEAGEAFDVRSGGTTARVHAIPAPAPARILVIARATWEAKFTVAALEEAGWLVDTRLRLSDTMTVSQGEARAPSLDRHGVVVLLDPVAGAEATGIARFVRDGGGLIVSGAAARSPALASLLPGPVQRLEPPLVRTFTDVEPLRALPLHVPGPFRADALLLESRGGSAAVAARRVALGRVVQSGYAESWRWRMEGEAGSVAAHRAWWSSLVALALPTPASPATRPSAMAPDSIARHPIDGAPLAALVHALGPASDALVAARPQGPPIPLWLGALILALLLLEWGLRRVRGLK